MRMSRVIPAAVFVFTIFSCTAQHRPEAHHKAIKEERTEANKRLATLAADGTIPVAVGAVAGSGNPKYDTMCASCHGLNGKADTPAALALTPHPRNFADAAWQGKVTDEHIAKVIAEGGAANGLSAAMAPWGAMVSGDELTKMVKTVRSFKGK